MKKDKRFEVIYQQGTMDTFQILVDKKTGVNYLYRTNGYAGGLTVLLNKEGNPTITPIVK